MVASPRSWRALLIALTLAAFTAGCAEPVHTVQGKVMLQGKALPAGTVDFCADAAKGNKTQQVPFGKIGADGAYQLNAPVGWYKVTLTTSDPDIPLDKRTKLNPRYSSPDQTPLSIEVVASPVAGAYDLALVP